MQSTHNEGVAKSGVQDVGETSINRAGCIRILTGFILVPTGISH